uniref:DUF4220 domain-containing protein n=1 Tax=Quercus lobata TaxID=97700 RepID=A0A7N2R465_QUELO
MWKVFQIFPESLRTIFNLGEIQAMVIISLSFQSILMVMGYRRRYTSTYRLNMVLWVAYLLADWFATVALSIISNYLGKKPIDPELIMTAFWAPFFLLHLGGLDTITAYSLEDNTLWRRHALSLVTQVTVGGYIFLRVWKNTHLNYIAAPTFIPGLIKIGERVQTLEWDKARSSNLKPKSTWTRINRMDFRLGGLSKALMLPTRGKRNKESNLEEEQCEDIDTREAKHGRVGSGDELENIISVGVESHPCREQ